MTAYYNEIDPFAAAWLRELIKAGHIAPGEVDTRSIEDVRADDLRGFTQCHFFAGIGVWSYALRCSGWPDDRPVWTGSCPCQPFSAAGKRGGLDDERHLWPAWFHLIGICRPPAVFGEQVASKDGLAWLDLVHADLEGQGYAVGCLDLCAAGFGAPHIRQRLYFVADTCSQRRQQNARGSSCDEEAHGREGRDGSEQDGDHKPSGDGPARLLADAPKCGSGAGLRDSGPGAERGIQLADRGELGNTSSRGCGERGNEAQPGGGGHADGTGIVGNAVKPGLEGCIGPFDMELQGRTGEDGSVGQTGPCNGFWSDAVWLPCRDGKARPTQSGLFPLVAGTSGGVVRGGNNGAPFNPNTTPEARVGRLRGYGNSIVSQVAIEFIKAYLERFHE